MVGTASADNPLKVVGPTDIGHMGRMANVLLKFGGCFRRGDPAELVYLARWLFNQVQSLGSQLHFVQYDNIIYNSI